jgi:hypothetical protein
VFENREQRSLFEPKRDEGPRGCIKLRNDELHDLYSSTYKNDKFNEN